MSLYSVYVKHVSLPVQSINSCKLKDLAETNPQPPPQTQLQPQPPLACESCDTSPRVSGDDHSSLDVPLPHDFQCRLWINPSPRGVARDHAANEKLMKELIEFFTTPKPGHLPEKLLQAIRFPHNAGKAETAEVSSNGDGTGGTLQPPELKQRANECEKQLSGLRIQDEDVCVHARGYLFVTLKFWFIWTDPNNTVSNSERDTATGSSISSTNSYVDRAVGQLKEAIENLFFKKLFSFQGKKSLLLYLYLTVH